MTKEQHLRLETTDDDSLTLYLDEIDEHYHSVKGALSESLHVYLDLGWRKFSSLRSQVKVFEVGFGTGLNAAVTAHAAMAEKIPTIYHSVELFPVSLQTAGLLADSQKPEYKSDFEKVNNASWEKLTEINPFFSLHKINDNLLSMTLPEDIDVVYFDAFAPEKQPEMWEERIFRKIYDSMAQGGILTTYCAKGRIRRMLQSVGFRVERLPGPPGGKREVMRARKI